MDFLKHFKSPMIQTFCDKGINKSLTVLVDADKVSDEELKRLNKEGAGIFFTPNQFRGRRTKASCLGINAWFMECDWCDKASQRTMIGNAPLKPSFIVETRSSYHTYWLAKDAHIDNFTIIQRRLIHAFNADEAIKDCSRVLRVPGYYHNKAEPFPVRLVHSDPSRVYTEEQMLKAFPPPPPKEYTNMWEAMGDIDTKIVLERLSGSSIVNGEIFTFKKRSTGGEHIYVNGQPADAWLDIEGKIGSSKKGGPTWIQWLSYYGRNKKEIYKWAVTNLNDLLPNFNSDLHISDLNFERIFADKKIFKWGISRLESDATVLQQEQYVVLAGATGSGKTTFALQMAIANAHRYRVLFLSLEMSNEALMLRYALTRLGITPRDWIRGVYDKDMVINAIKNIPNNLCFRKINEPNIDSIRKLVEEGAYDMVFVDNFGYVEGRGSDQNEKMLNISRQLKWLANETGTCVVALHHYRKRSGEKEGVRPMDSLMGSAKISHDANIVIQLWRFTDDNATEEQKSTTHIIIQKDRDFGHTGSYMVTFNRGQYIDCPD